jgi:shikimate dehydrogenase
MNYGKSNIMITAQTKVLGVLGYPLKHTLSPLIQNYALQKAGIDAVYMALPCPPEQLESALQGIRAFGFTGVNVTIPYKEAIIPFIDEVSDAARFMGSVNTLYWNQNKLCGTSTDGYGAIANLKAHGIETNSRNICILGNGGSARAIIYEILTQHSPKSLCILGRSLEKLELLCNEFNSLQNNPVIATFSLLENFTAMSPEFDLIINTTSCGMHPHTQTCAIDTSSLGPAHIVYDIVYNPKRTLLLHNAKQQGAQIVEGAGMLVHQGAKAFRYWFDKECDTSGMLQLMLGELEA